MALLGPLSRSLLAGVFVASGADVFRNPEARAELARPFLDTVRSRVPGLPTDDVALVRANAGVMVAAGTLLGLGRLPRVAALALAGSLVPTTLAGHRFWEVDDPKSRSQQRIHFLKNTAMLGGLLAVAAG